MYNIHSRKKQTWRKLKEQHENTGRQLDMKTKFRTTEEPAKFTIVEDDVDHFCLLESIINNLSAY